MDFTKEIDYTAISCYLACPRKFLFRHVLHLVRDIGVSLDLHFGKCFHTGLEAAYNAVKKVQEDGDKVSATFSPEVLAEIAIEAFNDEWDSIPHGFDPDSCAPKSPFYAADAFRKYFKTHWYEVQQNTVIGVEIPFSIPLFDQSESMPEGYNYIGRLDLLDYDVEHKVVRTVEHKTTKYDNQTWMEGFRSNYQIEGYLAAGYYHTGELPLVMVNGIKLNKTKITFPRVPVQKNQIALERFVTEMRYHVKRLLNEYDCLTRSLASPDKEELLNNPAAYFALFPRNCYTGGPCTMFFRPCEYLDHCQMRNNPLTWLENPPIGMSKKEWDPRDPDGKLKKGV